MALFFEFVGDLNVPNAIQWGCDRTADDWVLCMKSGLHAIIVRLARGGITSSFANGIYWLRFCWVMSFLHAIVGIFSTLWLVYSSD
jgi:hypothetical protein